MAQAPHLLIRILASATVTANFAGKIVRDVMNKGDLGIVDKGKNDLQTEADRSAQLCIIGSLSRQFPKITIIGEEGTSTCHCPEEWITTTSDQEVLSLSCPEQYHNLSESDVTVWVDPLDGTSEYTQGLLDHVTVLIGIAVKEKAVAGVIHQPYYNYQNGGELGRTVWGFEGVGVGGFVPTSPPKGQRIITTTRSHSNPVVQATLDALKPDKVLKVGGAGHKVMLLMEGKAHAYVFASGGTKRWDTCAPEAILHAAGGKLTDLHGNTYSYAKDTSHANSGGVLATAHSDEHDIYLKSIPSEVREKLS
ncbi:3'(2'),5'-bisphosphate nucleotidase 1 isoform X1 [Homalodisca vitripennis]|uniref:3'(2'),5'-bisphosphate nucleotidase 1 isoform X1 n=1 Tax=Homalodisca vitripennis TaxID=197043 RepID=UPI001EE9ED8C|nr:3'(2'),5'-bisphosphate nucleotidase 1 isoform X1 [Homalodisca vitripennis]XP_046679550.1 3'(2'),5'-bisphosphate nucleotidase 1 isoform X1 [Homalodisca vitripennis]